MGYYAYGCGYIKFAEHGVPKKIDSIIEKLSDAGFSAESDYDKSGAFKGISLVYEFEKYYEDEIIDSLGYVNNVSRIKEGSAEFTGEDDEHWRFLFENGKWNEENGKVVYGSSTDDKELAANQIIEIFEGFLEQKGIQINKSEHPTLILGNDYGLLTREITGVMRNWVKI